MRANLFPLILAILLAGCLGTRPVDPAIKQVPVMAPPALDEKISPGEWDAALPVQGVFTINDGTAADGNYPFDLKLGHDTKWLFALMVVHDVPMPNPFDGQKNGQASPGARHGWNIEMFLDSKLGAGLQSPEDWKDFNNVAPMGAGSSTMDGYWTGSEWTTQSEGGDPQNVPWHGNYPGSGTWGRGWYEGHDLLWEIYIPLHSPDTIHDGFQASPGDTFRLCLLWWVQGGLSQDGRGPFRGSHDTFPGDGYTPNGHYDPSTWMRLQLA
jgi:hypothetical protein